MHCIVTNLLIFSLLRLQFVCCCGSVVSLGVTNEGVIEGVESCSTETEQGHVDRCRPKDHCKHGHDHQCKMSLAHEKTTPSESTASDDGLASTDPVHCTDCCNCNQSHRHHLNSFSSAKNSTNPKVNLGSLVLFHDVPSWKILVVPVIGYGSLTEECINGNAVGILTLLGQLLI